MSSAATNCAGPKSRSAGPTAVLGMTRIAEGIEFAGDRAGNSYIDTAWTLPN